MIYRCGRYKTVTLHCFVAFSVFFLVHSILSHAYLIAFISFDYPPLNFDWTASEAHPLPLLYIPPIYNNWVIEIDEDPRNHAFGSCASAFWQTLAFLPRADQNIEGTPRCDITYRDARFGCFTTDVNGGDNEGDSQEKQAEKLNIKIMQT